jgi:hypothetical protein
VVVVVASVGVVTLTPEVVVVASVGVVMLTLLVVEVVEEVVGLVAIVTMAPGLLFLDDEPTTTKVMMRMAATSPITNAERRLNRWRRA